MNFKNFRVNANLFLDCGICECGEDLREIQNEWRSSLMFCQKCKNVYEIKLVKVPRKQITKEFLEQCRKQTN